MGCYTFIKVMMILFNTLIFLGGGTLLGIGIWVSVDSNSFLQIFGTLDPSVSAQFVNVGYFLIAIGSLLVILGFIGCCGAQNENKCLLLIFFSLILIIFIAEIAGAVVAFVYTSLAENLLTPLVKPVLQNQYGNPSFPKVTNIWNQTMNDVQCCGLTGYSDFDNSYFRNQTKSYPIYCCNASPCNLTNAQATNRQGCFQKMLDTVKKNAAIVGGVAAGVCALELAAMIVSMYMYCQIDKGGSIH